MICRNDENVQHKVQTLGPPTQFTQDEWDKGEPYRTISTERAKKDPKQKIIDSDSLVQYGTMFGYRNEGDKRLGVSDFADNPQVGDNTKEVDKLVRDAERRKETKNRMIDKNRHTTPDLVQRFLDSKAKS
jgi:hypothetical protein